MSNMKRKGLVCSVEGCERPILARGLCNAHYIRERNDRPLTPPLHERQGPICKVKGCEAPTSSHGGFDFCRSHYRRWIRRTRTAELVEMLGGKCARCGNAFEPACFDFHHRNPGEKLFAISDGIENRSMEALIVEARKCELLCANCHRKEHYSGEF